MGLPRAGKRVVVISSDEEESEHEGNLSDEETGTTKSTTTNKITNGRQRAKEDVVTSRSTPDPTPPTSSATTKAKRIQKTAVKAEPKKSKGTIYSFFNAATQQQQKTQRLASPPKPSQQSQSEQIIDDVQPEDAAIPFAQGSQIALASRKRKLKQNDQVQAVDVVGVPSSTQKFLKTSDGVKVPSRQIVEDRRPWTEQYAPGDLSELAVHKKKVNDVRAVLEGALYGIGRPRLIVLKGSAGTGKTATVNLLAKDLDLEVLEWKNPVGAEMISDGYVSASAQFEDFVLRSGKFVGLDLISGGNLVKQENGADEAKERSQIIMIEEFPNTFARSSNVLQSFRSTIQQYLSAPRNPSQRPTPLVMVISETLLSTSTVSADSFTAHRLLGPSILTHPLVAEIEFNAVAPTILTKALELIVLKEARKSGRRRTPGPQVLKHLAETGDIRSAISSLEFLCLRDGGNDPDTWSAKIAFTKPKSKSARGCDTTTLTALTKQEQEALKLIGNRESTLGIFHAVGKVVYNKRLPAPVECPQPPTHLPQYRKSKIPETDADVLITELGTDISTFVAALHENYVLSCASTSSEESLESLNGCIDALSDADLLAPDRFGPRGFSGSALDSLRQDDLSFQTAVRGVLFALPSPVSRSLPGGGGGGGSGGRAGGARGAVGKMGDAHRMFYPTSLKLWKRKEEIEGVLELVVTSLGSRMDMRRKGAIDGGGGGGGVDGWRRDTVDTKPAEHEAGGDERNTDASTTTTATELIVASSLARKELLLERLPYLNRILARRAETSSLLKERINTLVSFDGLDLAPGDDEMDGEDDDVVGAGGDWSTDPPDGAEEGTVRTSRKRGGYEKEKGKGRIEREGGGLNLPVEHAVERLVLEDDDIED